MPKLLKTHFLPPRSGTIGPDDIALVTDILRASSVIVAALAAGVKCVRPFLEIEEAVEAASHDAAPLLCGERTGIKVPGFDLGNSPGDFTSERCQGRTAFMTTTNGTRAILAATEAKLVKIVAFTNMTATVESMKDFEGTVHLVCSGTDGYVSWEDTLACGMAADLLESSGYEATDDTTRLAMAAYRHELHGLKITDPDFRQKLGLVLRKGRGGRRVREIGLEKDIDEVARLDDFAILCHVEADPWRIVAS